MATYTSVTSSVKHNKHQVALSTKNRHAIKAECFTYTACVISPDLKKEWHDINSCTFLCCEQTAWSPFVYIYFAQKDFCTVIVCIPNQRVQKCIPVVTWYIQCSSASVLIKASEMREPNKGTCELKVLAMRN